MNKDSQAFLYKLLRTPSPTGFEQRIQKVVKSRMQKYADTIEIDLHGNLIVGMNVKAKRRVMLAGHCDQIGFIVRHIDSDGYVYVDTLGGIDAATCLGARVTIHGAKGPVDGFFGRKPIHMQTSEERTKPRIDIKKMWIDIGAKDQKDAEKRIAIADPVTFQLDPVDLTPDLVCSPGLDDKAGLFIAMEAMRLCARAKLSVALYSVSTVQEEIGVRGATTSAYGVNPEIGVAIDVTHSTDNPGHDDSKASPCELGSGPGVYSGPNINPIAHKMMVAAAKKSKIPYQPLPTTRPLGNDTRALQLTRAGVASACLGVPNRYMHTQAEVCSKKDLENSAKLLAAFIKSIGPRTDFRPR